MEPPSQQLLTCPTCGAALEETFGGGGGCMFCLLQAGIGGDEAQTQDSTPNAPEGDHWSSIGVDGAVAVGKNSSVF